MFHQTMSSEDRRQSYPPIESPSYKQRPGRLSASPATVPTIITTAPPVESLHSKDHFNSSLSPESARDVQFTRLSKIKSHQGDPSIDAVVNGDREPESTSRTPGHILGKLRHSGSSSRQSLREDSNSANEAPAQGNFLSSVLSAAQTVLRGGVGTGNEHKRSASDGAFFGFINEAAQPFHDPLSTLSVDQINDEDGESIQKVSDVKIEPIRSAISTLGKGELSLESLGLTPRENPMQAASMSANSPYSNTNGFNNSVDPDNTSQMHDQQLGSVSLSRNGSLKVLDTPRNSLPSSEVQDPRRQSFEVSTPKRVGRSRHSLIGRRSTDKSSTKPNRSHSVNSFYKSRPRNSFTDDQVHANADADPASPVPFIAAVDSDDSDRPRARGEEKSKHLAGFAYANKKRNQEFHKLFRSIPPNDLLYDDFSCALSREILIQGRMYVSESNICFNSNILGWVTSVVISFDEIVGLEKKTTAGLFPNGIVVQTLHARHSFASFINRDSVFGLLMSIWRQTNARMEVSDQSDNEKFGFGVSDVETEESSDPQSGSASEFEEYDESAEDMSDIDTSDGLSTDEEFGESARQAKPQQSETTTPEEKPADTTVSEVTTEKEVSWPVPNLGPETHAPSDPHYDYEGAGEKLLISETVSAPLGVVCNLLFGDNVKWITTFITDKEKNVDLKNMSGFEGGLSNGHKRNYEYVKPLAGAVGPKQTRCICTDTIEAWDLEKSITVVTSTQTPDVPSGGVFTTKTRYTIFWGENNTTRVLLTYLIDWTGKSWFKGPIEKGTQDGQLSFAKNLIHELNASVKKSGKTAVAGTGSTVKVVKKTRKSISNGTKKKKKTPPPSIPAEEEPVVRRITELLRKEPFSMVPIPAWVFIMILLLLIWTFQAMSRGNSDMSSHNNGDFYSRTSSLTKEKLDVMRMEEEYNIWRWIDARSGQGRMDSAFVKNGQFKRSDYYEQNLEEAVRLTELRLERVKKALDL